MSKDKPFIVHGKVLDARYFQTSQTFCLLVQDLERKKNFKPFEVTPSQFGISTSLKPELYEFFADQLKSRSSPIRIEFEGDREFEEAVKKALKRESESADGRISGELKQGADMLNEAVEMAKKDDNFILKQIFSKND